MANDSPIPVTVPVTATVGPLWLGLFPPKAGDTSPNPEHWDDGLPWAWCAITHVTFRFGKRQTTKKVTARHRWPDQYDERPSGEQVEAGRLAVIEDIRSQLADHGIKAPEFQIEKADPSPARVAPFVQPGPERESWF